MQKLKKSQFDEEILELHYLALEKYNLLEQSEAANFKNLIMDEHKFESCFVDLFYCLETNHFGCSSLIRKDAE